MWENEIEKLRQILEDCDLTEEKKWGKPCFCFEGKNIVVIQPFKQYFALLFLKGYLLDDPDGVLVKTGENTVVGRQMRFTDAREIAKMKAVIKSYVYQAIEVERSGVSAAPPKAAALAIPEELQVRLDKSTALKKAFTALTPGRQKAYNIYFSQPKQSKTRTARVEKYLPQILKGKGLND